MSPLQLLCIGAAGRLHTLLLPPSAAPAAPIGQEPWPMGAAASRKPPEMTSVARQEVLGLYRRIFRIAKKWQSASGQMEDTIKEKQYIINEAKTLFQKNKDLTDPELIKQCIEECKARVEIGLHYHIPYPRPGVAGVSQGYLGGGHSIATLTSALPSELGGQRPAAVGPVPSSEGIIPPLAAA
ncbi:LYR motif-containing protein 1 [Chelonia mydas]|uniref:LYR motif-containing protein 1 n=1 Tax=Chelonia mydas TaxID=8469 RepID=M7BTQ9_CHEMY|nr:LYR motif-containing protein 1 [Chelonia mydas]